MKITVQHGCSEAQFKNLIYQLVVAGAECDAQANRRRHADRMALIAKQGGSYRPKEEPRQGELFGGVK